MSHLDALIRTPGPKKMLAIDGGGIRGLIAIEFLARIEAMLRRELKRENLLLCEYFDYVGGTSTGAIIATLVALGFSVDEIRAFYRDGAEAMFTPANQWVAAGRKFKGPVAMILGAVGLLSDGAMFTKKKLEAAIKSVIEKKTGDAEAIFGSDKLRTLLLIVTRNATTDSPWPLSNNPYAKYNVREPGPDGTLQKSNLDIPLWQLVRASTAAPVFFGPEEIRVPGVTKPFLFQDGGTTVYNNPAFQMFLMATLPAYNLNWTAAHDQLLLVSVGTGFCESANKNLKENEMNLIYNLQSMPAALMRAATVEQDILCRVFGRVRSEKGGMKPIDLEIGDLIGIRSPLSDKLMSYVRYNVDLSEDGLREIGATGIDPKSVQPLDGKLVGSLEVVGRKAAEHFVSIEDFKGFLSLRAAGG
ncbi:MAG TPA: patatin-like phospholipase family protein [Candidatus Acidoferrales bacterium]|nr:patatin-like phospholipase family protein [Candidatus Acidoferrales bacterium]